MSNPRHCTGSNLERKIYKITTLLNKFTTLVISENEQRKNNSSYDWPSSCKTGAWRGGYLVLPQSTKTGRNGLPGQPKATNLYNSSYIEECLHTQIKNSIRPCGTIPQALNTVLIVESALQRRNCRPRPPDINNYNYQKLLALSGGKCHYTLLKL